jgi:hypothetical protein
MKTLSCRSVTAGLGAAVAAVPAASVLASPALAVEEDAQLKRLWEEWNAQWLRWELAAKAYDQVSASVLNSIPAGLAPEQHEKKRRTAERRFKYPAARRADDRAGDRVMAVERKIRKAPAEGYKGIAIKLAPEMVLGPDDSPEFHLLESIYKTAVNLSDGVDIAAEVKRW